MSGRCQYGGKDHIPSWQARITALSSKDSFKEVAVLVLSNRLRVGKPAPAVGLVREEDSWLLAQEVNFSFLQGDINIWS